MDRTNPNRPSDVVLAHYGIPGMRWGKRKGESSSSNKLDDKKSTDYSTAEKHKAQIKTSGTKALSNKELQAVVNRMNLEQQYTKLTTSPKKDAGENFVAKMLKDNAKQLAAQYAQKGVKMGVEYALNAVKNR